VAQTRLAKVMLTNSVVLKEESEWIEFYYRWVVGWWWLVGFVCGWVGGSWVGVVGGKEC
jgi:hypothetical protein